MSAPPRSRLHRETFWSRGWRVALLGMYWLTLGIATHLPATGGSLHENQLDKVLHFVAYALLAWLMAWAWGPRQNGSWRWVLGIWSIAAAYGAIDEILQAPVGRSCDVLDWLADIAGAAFGLLVYRWRWHARQS